MTDRGPVYDGVGPRTSATGASVGQKSNDPTKMASIPELDERQALQQQQREFLMNNARLRTSSLKRFPMAGSHIHQPCLIMSSAAGGLLIHLCSYGVADRLL